MPTAKEYIFLQWTNHLTLQGGKISLIRHLSKRVFCALINLFHTHINYNLYSSLCPFQQMTFCEGVMSLVVALVLVNTHLHPLLVKMTNSRSNSSNLLFFLQFLDINVVFYDEFKPLNL